MKHEVSPQSFERHDRDGECLVGCYNTKACRGHAQLMIHSCPPMIIALHLAPRV